MSVFIDFSLLAEGPVVEYDLPAKDMMGSTVNGSKQTMIFRSLNPTVGDRDLTSADPNSQGDCRALRIVTSNPPTVNRLTFLDVDTCVCLSAPNTQSNAVAAFTTIVGR